MKRAEAMAYFDMTEMESVPQGKAAVLGYRKILPSNEIRIVTEPLGEGKCIVESQEQGILGRALRRNNVVGVIIKDNELLRMTVEEIRTTDKMLVVPVHGITCSDTRTRMRNIYRAKGLIAFALRAKAKIALVSLAKDPSCMLSSQQMLLLAEFLGASDIQSKAMLSSMGDVL